jgi:PhzF family phenazine biosynthesis protein
MPLHKLTAFSDTPSGGNPAGVWLGDQLPAEAEMQRIAAEVGFSETAFIAPQTGPERTIRYFSPEIEVPFCGHATIASGVLLGQTAGAGRYLLHTQAGDVPVDVDTQDGLWRAALTSVAPRSETADPLLVSAALETLGWRAHQLDSSLPAARAYAGAWHLVLAVSELATLNALDYDFEGLKSLMQAHNLTTLQLIWRESDTVFHSRNPFPVGGVVEDPATGAAAAALGGYLRDSDLLATPAQFTIRQGEAMGRPSLLTVDVPLQGGIVVSGTAVSL